MELSGTITNKGSRYHGYENDCHNWYVNEAAKGAFSYLNKESIGMGLKVNEQEKNGGVDKREGLSLQLWIWKIPVWKGLSIKYLGSAVNNTANEAEDENNSSW